MSSIPYSGGTIVNTTFTGTDRAAIVSGMETALTAAGWSVISGTGTGDVLMKTAVTATANNSIRMRLYDPGSGNCAQITMKNDAGDKTSQIIYLLPAAEKTFRVIACRYNFFILTAGTTAAREFACGGTLYTPSFLHGVITADFGWLQGNSVSDTDTSVDLSFRTALHIGTGNLGRFSGLVNGSLVDMTGASSAGIGAPILMVRVLAEFNRAIAGGYRWHDDSLHVSEAMLSWGLTASSDEGKVRGIIHNCLVLSADMAGDDTSISNYDGHAWYAITNSNGGSATAYAKGTLLAAIS